MSKIDHLQELRYRLLQLKEPSRILLNNIDKAIAECDRSNANPSTKDGAPENSATSLARPKQLTLR